MVAGDVNPGVSASKQPKRKRRPVNPEGAMTLLEHLREFQARLFRAVLGILLGAVVAWIFYEQIFAFIRAPFDQVVAEAQSQGKVIVLAINGVSDAFTLQLQIVLVSALVIASPIWLYQLWRFLAPGLKHNERKWAYAFVFTATPLFLFGAWVAYAAMPPLLALLLGFTPENVSNIINVNTYLGFTLQIMLFFGLGAMVPAIFVMLNFAGLLAGSTLLRAWRWLLIGCLTFAAIATPSPDPLNMLAVAAPFLGLVSAAVALMLLNDVRRARKARREGLGRWADDEVSELPERIEDPADLRPSPLDDDIT